MKLSFVKLQDTRLKHILLFILIFTGFTVSAQDMTVSELYERVQGSVVSIYTEEKVPVKGLQQEMTTSEGIGSGVLLTDKGDILTASHVVHNAENIVVGFPDGTKIPARILGSVVAADLAHIQLEWMPDNPTIAQLGDSDLAKTGDEVVVIGSPYGIERSLSVGHISGRHINKDISQGLHTMELLQTDAAINQGNSGGPMFNMKGEVIGIVSYILSETGGFQGIGFVVSSNMAKKLFIEEKAFWSGFESIIVSGDLAAVLNLPQDGGLLVQRVVINSPAYDMGLKGGTITIEMEEEEILLGGDVILAINDIPTIDEDWAIKVRENLTQLKKGDMVKLTVIRAGKILDLKSTSFIGN